MHCFANLNQPCTSVQIQQSICIIYAEIRQFWCEKIATNSICTRQVKMVTTLLLAVCSKYVRIIHTGRGEGNYEKKMTEYVLF